MVQLDHETLQSGVEQMIVHLDTGSAANQMVAGEQIQFLDLETSGNNHSRNESVKLLNPSTGVVEEDTTLSNTEGRIIRVQEMQNEIGYHQSFDKVCFNNNHYAFSNNETFHVHFLNISENQGKCCGRCNDTAFYLM